MFIEFIDIIVKKNYYLYFQNFQCLVDFIQY